MADLTNAQHEALPDDSGQLVRDVRSLVEERDRLRAGIVRFYVAHGPHLSASWQEHFRELLGDDLPRLGLREVRP